MTLKNFGADTVSLLLSNADLFASNLMLSGGGYGVSAASSNVFAVNSEVWMLQFFVLII